MSETETEPTETTVNRKRRVRRFFAGLKNILLMRIETRVIGLIVAGVMVFSGGAFLFDRQESLDASQRAADDRERDEEIFEAARLEWSHDSDIYEACLNRVASSAATRDTLRGLFVAFADLSDILPGVDEAEQYTENRVKLLDAVYPPIDVKDQQSEQCVPPGPAPVNPEGES